MTHLVVLSGGLDSTAALAVTLDQTTDPVSAISFDYGQRHRRELASARQVATHYRINHQVLDINGFLHGSALLGDVDVPEGHYADDTMSATVVQGRNLLFAAAAIAATNPGDTLVVGVHAGDHPVYPDCRPMFWWHLAEAAKAYEVTVLPPFIHEDKAEVVRRGTALRAPFHLTWSCYAGGIEHCGRCGTCVERAEAFHLAGVRDPTPYEDPEFWRAATAS